jgi:catechol 2,3-dioxygenase-like lactoylglutathione lyase family enzyme/ketosteroid isomerase-like protein
MSAMNETHEVELLRRAWEALARSHLTLFKDMLAPDAKWYGVEDGQLCADRNAILDVIGRNLPGRLRGSIEEMIQDGPRVIVAFRPEQAAQVNRPLDEGIAYVVVTIRNGKIIEMKGCADRAAALAYSRGEGRNTGPLADCPPAPKFSVSPAEQRVTRLVPFVHVDDVERSIAFYQHLGFTVESLYEYQKRPVWAALQSEGAELMVTLDGDSVDPAGQGVLFYLYSHDLAALRDQLLAAGIEAGHIEDGTPGPSQEMRLTDPDGYVLMVAQTE